MSYTVSIVVKDTAFNEELSPSNVSLAELNALTYQVSQLVRGSKKNTDLGQIKTKIRQGSLAFDLSSEEDPLDDLANDLKVLSVSNKLYEIDPARSNVISIWQKSSRLSPDRIFEVQANNDQTADVITLFISNNSNFQVLEHLWVESEHYLLGEIYDIGGKKKSNIHMELEDGTDLTINADSSLLRNDETNRVYKTQLVRVKAKKNYETGELADVELLSFEKYNPVEDEDEQARIVRSATEAWRDVTNPSEWLEELRGEDD